MRADLKSERRPLLEAPICGGGQVSPFVGFSDSSLAVTDAGIGFAL